MTTASVDLQPKSREDRTTLSLNPSVSLYTLDIRSWQNLVYHHPSVDVDGVVGSRAQNICSVSSFKSILIFLNPLIYISVVIYVSSIILWFLSLTFFFVSVSFRTHMSVSIICLLSSIWSWPLVLTCPGPLGTYYHRFLLAYSTVKSCGSVVQDINDTETSLYQMDWRIRPFTTFKRSSDPGRKSLPG